jgi:Cu2+-exporting ATPase
MLSGSVRPPQSSAWVVRDGVELETPLTKICAGDVVAVREGEMIPVDGRIVSGTAVVDETSVRGTTGLAFHGMGDGVYEGTCLVEGALHVEVLRAGDATVANAIDRTLTATAAGMPAGKTAAPPEFAERAVPPVLMTAGVGLLMGDAAVAAAVLRPDYATGPGLGDSVALIDRLGNCFDLGIVIRRTEAFEQIATADVVVFDHDQFLEARVLQIEHVHVAGGCSADDVLSYAACGVRRFHDPRARAVCAAAESRGQASLDLPVTYRSGAVEFALGSRVIRITGLEQGTGAPLASPLFVFSNGELAGSLVFCKGTNCVAAAAILDLRTRCGMQVELLSSAPVSEAEQFATALGVDGLHPCPSDEAREEVIRGLCSRGSRVVYVGNCRKNPRAAAAAQVAVFSCPDPAWEADPSCVWLLQPHYERLADLREMAVAMRRQADWHCNLILIPNMVCIAGAFLFGFTSLAVVILSNLGTYSVYSRSRAALRRTERRLRDRQNRLRPEPSSRAADRGQRRLTLQET